MPGNRGGQRRTRGRGKLAIDSCQGPDKGSPAATPRTRASSALGSESNVIPHPSHPVRLPGSRIHCPCCPFARVACPGAAHTEKPGGWHGVCSAGTVPPDAAAHDPTIQRASRRPWAAAADLPVLHARANRLECGRQGQELLPLSWRAAASGASMRDTAPTIVSGAVWGRKGCCGLAVPDPPRGSFVSESGKFPYPR